MSSLPRGIHRIDPGAFRPENHWYPAAFNATIHPMVAFLMHMRSDQIVARYCHLHPAIDPAEVQALLAYKPKYFLHSGTDLIHATNDQGNRSMVVIETNSCPSGQKSMPLLDDIDEFGGYRRYVRDTMVPAVKKRRRPKGVLAVLYDKNPMEASGYAAAMAEEFGEPVYLVSMHNDPDELRHVRFEDDLLYVKIDGEWSAVRACFRYVTQKPWNRIPVVGKTLIFNPVIVCLAGGRNKLVASKAYEAFNADYKERNLSIAFPETIWDVQKAEIPFWVERMGGKAVVKIPYSNAGQGVFTIINQAELDAFMAGSYDYDKFVVQALIGNHKWSSELTGGKMYHVGTVPDKQLKSYALDFRMLLQYTPDGYRPLGVYSRRAADPLTNELGAGNDSWGMLGTNLSVKLDTFSWGSDTARLMLMDRKGFNRLGVGLDDLIDGFVQSVMATVAIDKMACNLINAKGGLKLKLFSSLNNDASLIDELF